MTPDEILRLITQPNQDGNLVLKKELPELDPSDFPCLIEAHKDLLAISPRRFESLVAELLRSDGYDEVHLIPRSNAPGPDIIAICQGPSGQKQEYIVECKRWNDVVGLDVVRQVMYRVDTERRSTGAIIVTTSGFTRDAVAEARRLHQWRLALKDGEAVLQWVNRHAASTRQEILGSKRLERLRSTRTGELIFTLISNPHLRPVVKISRLACERCGGPIACGQANIGTNAEPFLYFFHACVVCLAASSLEVKERLSECPFCGDDFEILTEGSELQRDMWRFYARRLQEGGFAILPQREKDLTYHKILKAHGNFYLVAPRSRAMILRHLVISMSALPGGSVDSFEQLDRHASRLLSSSGHAVRLGEVRANRRIGLRAGIFEILEWGIRLHEGISEETVSKIVDRHIVRLIGLGAGLIKDIHQISRLINGGDPASLEYIRSLVAEVNVELVNW